MRKQVAYEALVVVARGILRDQDFAIGAVPAPRPVLVGPAEAIREIRAARFPHFLHRTLEQALAGEPVVVVAEPVNAAGAGKCRLLFSRFGDPQVVEPQVGGQVRLVMTVEVGSRARDVGPFGETRPPPAIVLRDRMKLRQVERDGAHRRAAADRRTVVHATDVVHSALAAIEGAVPNMNSR